MSSKRNTGFTLIELLVVVAIIGVLAGVVLSSLNSARSKGMDARRKADLSTIRTALELYYSQCGTYVVAQNCNGTAYGSGGSGFFNHAYYAGSAGSVSQGLVANGTLSSQVIDPTGSATGANSYMIVVNSNRYTIWATISNPSAADTATLSNCYFSNYDNYSGAGTQNYCISN